MKDIVSTQTWKRPWSPGDSLSRPSDGTEQGRTETFAAGPRLLVLIIKFDPSLALPDDIYNLIYSIRNMNHQK
jgi:hypothetical protein